MLFLNGYERVACQCQHKAAELDQILLLIQRHIAQTVLQIDDVEYAAAAQPESPLVVDEEARWRYDPTGQIGRVYRAYDRGQLNHVLPHAVLGQQTERFRVVYRFARAIRPSGAVQIVRIGPAFQVNVGIVVETVLESVEAGKVVVDEYDRFKKLKKNKINTDVVDSVRLGSK